MKLSSYRGHMIGQLRLPGLVRTELVDRVEKRSILE